MMKFTGRGVAAFGVALAAILAAGAEPAEAAMRPAPIEALAGSQVQPAQFRFPWETQAKPRRRAKRTDRARGTRQKKPAAGARRTPPAAKTPAKAAAAPGKRADPKPEPVDLSKATLPPDAGPPWVATWRDVEDWYAVAGRIPSPDFAPPFPPSGPLADIEIVMLAPLPPEDAAFTRPEPADEASESAAVAPHAPLPVPNPRMATPEPQLHDGLEPEGRGLAPERGGLAPEGRGLSPEGPPLPPRRPADVAALSTEEPAPPPGPSEPDIPLPVVAHDDDPDCRALDGGEIAKVERLPPIEGPGVCGGGPLVSLAAIKRADGATVEVRPAATLRCSMARALAEFVRSDVAPAVDGAGLSLVRVNTAGSFQCRGRNGASGGKMSEHGRANAIDLASYGFADGRTIGVFSADLPNPAAEKIRTAACERFSTVLGPGSDGFHDDHLHLDLQPRRSKSKLCQWSDPPVAAAKDGDADRDKAGTEKPDAEPKSRAAP